VRPLHRQHGRTPYEILTGDTPNLSEFLEYEWYQLVWYYEHTAFPEQRKHSARKMGLAHRIEQAMYSWLLPESGIPIARTTIQTVTQDEINTASFQKNLMAFDKKVGDKLKVLSTNADPISGAHLYHEDVMGDIQEDDTMEPESIDTGDDIFDQLLLVQPLIETVEGKVEDKMIGRKRDQDGNLIGTYNKNPILNTILSC
jgi:hypothetical protein